MMKFSFYPFAAVFCIFVVTQFGTHCLADTTATFNINTFQAKPIVVPPLQEQISIFDQVTVVNDGNGIDIYVDGVGRKNFIRGGVLTPTDVFIGYQIRFSYNASIFGTSGLTFNGFGTPLLADSFWYNAKYGSATNAASFGDGIVVIRDSIRIGLPNVFFPPFEAVLNQVQKVGSRVNTILAIGYFFFYPIGIRGYYYTYKGYYSNTFGDIPLKYNLATVIVTPLEYTASISAVQFNAFQRLLIGGQSVFGTSPAFFKQPKVPVYCANGPIAFSFTF